MDGMKEVLKIVGMIVFMCAAVDTMVIGCGIILTLNGNDVYWAPFWSGQVLFILKFL